jgi:hypothetical protein
MQAVVTVNCLDGDTGQTASRASAWIQVPPGMIPQLSLGLSAETGTFGCYLETCNQVVAGAAVDTPRPIGYFKQTPGAALPTSTPMSGGQPTDNWVRVQSQVGNGGSVAWLVSGRFIAASYAQQL